MVSIASAGIPHNSIVIGVICLSEFISAMQSRPVIVPYAILLVSRSMFEERKNIIPLSGHEDAFFLSMQRKRITPRAVENLVKKYAQIATPLKKITPHKLRSTYGTMLYQESGDIYLVADVLGHKDVNTTRKHYAAMTEEKTRLAAKYIKLREDDTISENPLPFADNSK